MAKKKQATPSFEAALAELQSIVESMEKGDVSLEESLQAFERGVELTRTCQTALMEAEKKIQALTKDGQLETFESGSGDSE